MVLDIYSKRIKSETKDDVFIYDTIPKSIRMQLLYIVDDIFAENISRSLLWPKIRHVLLREYGLETLSGWENIEKNDCYDFIKNTRDINNILDFIEVALFCINEISVDKFYGKLNLNPIEKEINHRLIENQLGYQVIDLIVIRIDRKFTHKEIVKPAINLLNEKDFESANNEFLAAHSFYKDAFTKSDTNEYFKNAIVNCNKAFESTMKIICENKKELVPNYSEKHTANELINDLIESGIIPKHLGNTFHGMKNMLKGLRTSLENGLPVIRNKSGHGLGKSEECISEEFVTYAMNLSATNIVLLVDIYKNL